MNQLLSEVMQNQSNSLITFETQLKTALTIKANPFMVFEERGKPEYLEENVAVQSREE